MLAGIVSAVGLTAVGFVPHGAALSLGSPPAITGVVLQNLALRAGRLSVALSTMTIAAPVTSTIIGVGLFGEDLDLSVATVTVAVAAGALAADGVVVLSRSAALEARPALAAAPAG